jgi:hypothetical protein
MENDAVNINSDLSSFRAIPEPGRHVLHQLICEQTHFDTYCDENDVSPDQAFNRIQDDFVAIRERG